MLDSSLVLSSRTLYTLDRTPSALHGLHFRGPRESVGFRVPGTPNSIYVAYLDEFGHVGPFISRSHSTHNTSPVFGLGGIVLPVERVRSFASFFYRLKCNLLAFEIERSGLPAHRWEKKGASLFTTQNVLRYAELRHATARLLNRIERDAGMIFYVGVEKARSSAGHDSKRLYRKVLRETLARLDEFCGSCSSLFLAVLDEHQDGRSHEGLVAAVSGDMFSASGITRMIEPPIHVQSHLFQTLQCADWICGLLGRMGCYLVAPSEYDDFAWVEKYFVERLERVAALGNITGISASSEARVDC